MNPADPAVAPELSGAVPSRTFSTDTINMVLSLFVRSAATLEEIADRAETSIANVLQCLEEQKPFLRNLLDTLDLRVRLLASRAEAIAIETLTEIALIANDKEACRKAASKLLSHFKRAPSPRSTSARGTGVPPVATRSTTAESAPAPLPAAQRACSTTVRE